MKAAVLKGLGSVDKLEYLDVDTPLLTPGYALIKVHYCGVNHLDFLIRQGKRPGPKKFPHVLGSEIIGVVEKISMAVDIFKVGDRVAVYPWTFCGYCKRCKSGNENICDNGGTVGRTTWGGYAEYAAVPLKNLIKIPLKFPEDEICALILAGTTADHLIERANIPNGSTVLITGSSGGVGTLVIQMLKIKKCEIVCATSHPHKKEVLQKIGVHHIISTQNMVEEIKVIIPDGVEFVIDVMGGKVWSAGVETLAKNGTMVFCATSLDESGQVNIGSAFSRQINLRGSYGGTMDNLKNVILSYNKGEIKPVIDYIFPLKEAYKAHEKIETQEVFGKLLLSPLR